MLSLTGLRLLCSPSLTCLLGSRSLTHIFYHTARLLLAAARPPHPTHTPLLTHSLSTPLEYFVATCRPLPTIGLGPPGQ
ncbi:hypothetical protein FKP32DRAFT_34740 [Trametes sanguinea]|nr:hypothetical protein FKP32DRAFT_34740 [Trametes sanguinea]